MPKAPRPPRPCTPRLGAYASALAVPLAVALAACGGSSTDAPSAPSTPKTYVGVDGEYAISGTFDDFRVTDPHFAGHVTLKQPDPASPTLTGTASVTVYFGTDVGPVFTHLASATRQGEGGVDLLLRSDTPGTGTWEFVGTVTGGHASGGHHLDLYLIPSSGGFGEMGGDWSGTR